VAADDYDSANEHCRNNRDELLASERCGCFYRLKVFEPNEIEQWLGGTGAVSPRVADDSRDCEAGVPDSESES
jgi:hypothetical protein